jgi:hypothetical protein
LHLDEEMHEAPGAACHELCDAAALEQNEQTDQDEAPEHLKQLSTYATRIKRTM